MFRLGAMLSPATDELDGLRSVREEVSYRDRSRCRVVDRCRLLGAWAATGEPCVRCVNETLLKQKEALGMTTTTYTPHDNAREIKCHHTSLMSAHEPQPNGGAAAC